MAQTKVQDLQLLLARILRLVNQDMRVLQRRGVGAQSLDRQPHHVLEVDLVQRMHAGVRIHLGVNVELVYSHSREPA